MDPNQAWRDLSHAIQEDEWGRAAEVGDELLDWLVKGGFCPEITGNPTFDRIVVRATCESVSAWEAV